MIVSLCGSILIPAACVTPQQAPASKASVSSASAGSGNIYRMKLVRIVDQHGFARPMTAMTLLIPIDWQFQGNVLVGDAVGCKANLVKLTFRAVSPDGRLGIEMFPSNIWHWADDPGTLNILRQSNQQFAQYGKRGCDVMAPMTADAYLRQAVIPSARSGAHVTGTEPMPDAAQRLQEEARQVQQVAATQGRRINIRTDAGRVRVNYSMNGQPMEEWFTAMTSSASEPMPTMQMGRRGETAYYTNGADHIFGMRAPQGQLDAQEKFFQLVLSTVTMDPQWEGMVRQVKAGMTATDTNAAAKQSQIIAQAGQQQANIIHQGFENANNSREHSMEGWSQYMRGVQTFRDPNTGDTVELSNQFAHAWAGPDGQYILSDSPNYNPNSSQQGNWKQLEAVTH